MCRWVQCVLLFRVESEVFVYLRKLFQWKDDKIKLSNTGSKIADLLQKTMIFDVEMAESLISGQVPKPECWERCVKQLTNHYEPVYGGFGLAPKFPQPSNLMFAFHAYARQPNSPKYEEIKKMCLHTLTMMAKGGIHDHVAQVSHVHQVCTFSEILSLLFVCLS